MEKNIYEDDFEQLLRDSADSFRMYPSKWVWNSIYNDLHPGRKWPSLAIWLLFISSVILIGLSNRNPDSIATKNKMTAVQNQEQILAGRNVNHEIVNTENITSKTSRLSSTQNLLPAVHSLAMKSGNPSVNRNYSRPDSRSSNQHTNTADLKSITAARVNENRNMALRSEEAGIAGREQGTASETILADLLAASTKVSSTVATDEQAELSQTTGENNNNNQADSKEKKEAEHLKSDKDNRQNEKSWIEDFAFHNKPNTSAWRNKVSYQFYLTPSIGYRAITQNTPNNSANNSSLLTPGTVRNYEEAVSQAAAVNMELGGNLLYAITKTINLKIGIQLNYTNYDINAYELKHPTIATLMLNNPHTGRPELSSRSTTLVNTEGIYSTRLKNNTYQVSLPIGADVKLAGNHQLKWFVGATIQPTFIAGGNAYLLSYDFKNYVSDNTLLRKWNVNAGVETFISYKTKSGITLNAGPQFRYQFLSTYTKEYTYDEKLYNVGLKIGIITRF